MEDNGEVGLRRGKLCLMRFRRISRLELKAVGR